MNFIEELKKEVNEKLFCDLDSKKRKQENVRGRVVFSKICRNLGLSYILIRGLLNKHHASIIHYTSGRYISLTPLIDQRIIEELTNKYSLK